MIVPFDLFLIDEVITLQVRKHLLQVSNLRLQLRYHFLLLQKEIRVRSRLLKMLILLSNHRRSLFMNTWVGNNSLYRRSLIEISTCAISIRLLINLKIKYLSLWSHFLIRTKLSSIFGTVSSRIRFLNIDLYLKIPFHPVRHPSTPILGPHSELHLILLLASSSQSFRCLESLLQASHLPFKLLDMVN
jgi:hypothetical protein